MTLKSFLLIVISLSLWGEPLLADGKLVIHSNVPGASVFLDGNGLAKTDASGNLTIDRLPDGSFSILLKKSGFHSIQIEVEISADTTSVVHLKMAPMHPSTDIPRPVKVHPKSGTPKENPSLQPETVEMQAEGTRQQNPKEGGGLPSAGQDRTFIYGLIVLLTLGSMLVILLLYPRRKVLLSNVRKSDPHIATPTEPPGPGRDSIPASSPAKESVERDASFLADLEHREELLRAGFVSEDRRRTGPREPSDPSTITLDKNEYEVKS